MSQIFKTVLSFVTPKKPVQAQLIEVVNDCGEKQYIEMERVFTLTDRHEHLQVLYTKCTRLLSFVMKGNWEEDVHDRIIRLTEDVRRSMYKSDDITSLLEDFECVDSFIKRSSINLSRFEHM